MKLNFYILCGLGLLVPVLVFPYSMDSYEPPKLLFIMVCVAAMMVIGVHKLNAIPKIVLILIAYMALTMFYTKNPYYTKVAVVLNSACLMVYFFVSEVKDLRKYLILLWIISLSGVAVGIFTWMDLGSPGNIVGTIGNSNWLGAYLIFPLMACAGLFMIHRMRSIPAVLGLFIFSAILIARARSSWIGLFVGIFVFLFLITYKDHKKLFKYALYGIIFFVLLGIKTGGSHGILDTASFKERWYGYWPNATEIWKENPLFGFGLWSYRNQVYDAQVKRFKRNPEILDKYTTPRPRRAHNEYLETLVDGGIVYAVLCAYFVVSVLVHGIRHIRREQERGVRYFILSAVISSVFGILVVAVFFFPFRVTTTLFMTCLSLGVVRGLVIEDESKDIHP